jgi:hypothetical protein
LIVCKCHFPNFRPGNWDRNHSGWTAASNRKYPAAISRFSLLRQPPGFATFVISRADRFQRIEHLGGHFLPLDGRLVCNTGIEEIGGDDPHLRRGAGPNSGIPGHKRVNHDTV